MKTSPLSLPRRRNLDLKIHLHYEQCSIFKFNDGKIITDAMQLLKKEVWEVWR